MEDYNRGWRAIAKTTYPHGCRKTVEKDMVKSISFLVSVLLLVFGSVSGCASPPTPTATPMISSDKAIEIAIGGCKITHLVLVGEPKNIHTKLITLEESVRG